MANRFGCRWLIAAVALMVATGPLAAAQPSPRLGSASAEIGTFHGWVPWVGWAATYSDSYDPVSQTYAWVVYFAPEAVYVALQGSQALYSGVDVNLGFDRFVGVLEVPNAATTVTSRYLGDLWEVGFSFDQPWTGLNVAAWANMSLASTTELSFFRPKHTTDLLKALQLTSGVRATLSLLPIDLPVGVSLDRDWAPPPPDPGFNGLWPIVLWQLGDDPSQEPITQVIRGLDSIVQDSPRHYATSVAMATALRPVLEVVRTSPDFRDLVRAPMEDTHIRRLLDQTESWLVSGDTRQLPQELRRPSDPPDAYGLLNPVQLATQLAFESAYRAGAQANASNRTVYVDGLVTNYCFVGEEVVIEVGAAELSAVIPNTKAEDFEGAWLGFDVLLEDLDTAGSAGTREWIQIEDGVGRFVVRQSLATAQLTGVVYDDESSEPPLNGGADVELRRRVLILVDRTDTNRNDLPDFWEGRFGLASASGDADSDGDGQTNLAEYLADTDPTDAGSRFEVQAGLAEGVSQLRLAGSSRDRVYTLESCVALEGEDTVWDPGLEQRGNGGWLTFNLGEYRDEEVVFFRVRVDAP